MDKIIVKNFLLAPQEFRRLCIEDEDYDGLGHLTELFPESIKMSNSHWEFDWGEYSKKIVMYPRRFQYLTFNTAVSEVRSYIEGFLSENRKPIYSIIIKVK